MTIPEISIPIYALFPSGILIFALGLYSWLKIRKKENFIFFLLTITQAVFAYGSVALFYSCGNDNLTTLIDRRLLYPFCIMMPILVYHFSLEFCQIKTRWQKVMLMGGYLVGLGLVIWSQFDSFVKGAYHYRWGCHTQSQLGNNFYVLLIIVFAILSTYNLFKVWRNKQIDALKRGQAVYILIGFIIFFLAGFILLWSYGIGVYPAAYLAWPLFTIVIAYAITSYRLMDIKNIFRATIVYLVSGFFFLTIIFAVIWGASRYTGIEVHWAITAIAFLAALLIYPALDTGRDFFARLVNKYLFSNVVDYQEITNDLAQQLAKEIELPVILRIITDTLTKKMKLTGVKIILFDKKMSVADSLARAGFNPETSEFVLKYFSDKGLLVGQELEFILDTTPNAKSRQQLRMLDASLKKNKIAVCLPLVVGDEYAGLIFLGEKPAASPYTKENLNGLLVFSSQASIAVTNARLYQEVRDYSQNLQAKVSEQTKDIRKKNEHLKKLLAMRSEFLNITSHQLRTPVSVIKGVLSMLKEEQVPEQEKDHFLETAYQKAIKLTDIVNDILLASEMESDKFAVSLERVQLNDIIQEVYNDKKIEAENKGIKLILALPPRPISEVLSNTKYLEQVLYNLVNNALQYTLHGSITIQVTEKAKLVYLRVIDTGIGIPPESLPKLFQRFSRAPNAVATFTDGSGLGLFITKEIIDAHRGAKIYVAASELGKGTTFTVELPKAETI